MYPNTDCILQDDYDRYQKALGEDDDDIEEADIEKCENCHAIIDENSRYCDEKCEDADLRYKELKNKQYV